VNVELNGAPRELADGTTLIELIESLAGSTRGSAVAVDDEVVPRGTWADYPLRDGQRVELITAVQGG
jgi:sulfur carrier protein